MYDHLYEALVRRFKLGQSPERTKRFYERLVAIAEQFGDPAFRVIKIVAAEAAGKNRPQNYFCKSVLRRLEEHGYAPMDESLNPPTRKAVTQ